MRINYDFNDLEAFLAVKETGSFHLAAERLNLSQSAVTRRVQKLEVALDSSLFDRTTREVKPTLAAKRLQARAEAILEDARETTRAMRDDSVAFSHQRNAIVAVAIIPTVARLILPKAIKRFRAAGYGARFRLLDCTANEAAEAVAKGEAAFGICSMPELEPNTQFESLFDDEIVLVHPAGHSLAGQTRVDWTDLTREDLIVPCRGTGNRLLIDEAMARAGLPLMWSYEFRRSTTAIEMVASHVGLALLPKSAVQQSPEKVGYVTVDNPKIVRPVGILTRMGQKPTQPEVAFVGCVKDVCATFGTGGD